MEDVARGRHTGTPDTPKTLWGDMSGQLGGGGPWLYSLSL